MSETSLSHQIENVTRVTQSVMSEFSFGECSSEHLAVVCGGTEHETRTWAILAAPSANQVGIALTTTSAVTGAEIFPMEVLLIQEEALRDLRAAIDRVLEAQARPFRSPSRERVVAAQVELDTSDRRLA